MKKIRAKQVVSYWERLKSLIAKDHPSVFGDIDLIDAYFNQELQKEIKKDG